MPAECTPKRFEFEAVGRRAVVARFDGGTILSNASALPRMHVLYGQVLPTCRDYWPFIGPHVPPDAEADVRTFLSAQGYAATVPVRRCLAVLS